MQDWGITLSKMLEEIPLYIWEESGSLYRPKGDKSIRTFLTGETRSGKTNSLEVINSYYNSIGWKLILFDVEGEYWRMKYPNVNSDMKYAIDNLQVYSPIFNADRAKAKGWSTFKINWEDLTSSDMIALVRYNQRPTYRTMISNTMEEKPGSLEELIDMVGKNKGAAKNYLLDRLTALKHLNVIGNDTNFDLDKLIKVDTPIVFDFYGCALSQDTKTDFMNGFVALTLRKLLEEPRKRIMATIDEARFLFKNEVCSNMITDFNSVSAKRNLSLNLATQYPFDIPPETAMNCNPRIIHRITEPRAKKYLAKTFGYTEKDLRLESIPIGEAVVMLDGKMLKVHIPLSPVGKEDELSR